MLFYLFKLLLTSAMIVLISEVAKRSDKLGGMIAALPLTTLFVIFWMYFEKQSDDKIASHMALTFYFVLPTLPMFVLFPYIIKKFGFLAATGGYILVTILLIAFFNAIYNRFGFHIL